VLLCLTDKVFDLKEDLVELLEWQLACGLIRVVSQESKCDVRLNEGERRVDLGCRGQWEDSLHLVKDRLDTGLVVLGEMRALMAADVYRLLKRFEKDDKGLE